MRAPAFTLRGAIWSSLSILLVTRQMDRAATVWRSILPQIQEQPERIYIGINNSRQATFRTQPASAGSNQKIPHRYLFGIFTWDSPIELSRRQVIRETYLSYYKHLNRMGTLNKICSLHELQSNQSLMEDPTTCQIVYTFVLGGNPSGASELYWNGNVASSSEMVVLRPPPLSNASDYQKYYTDMTFLNIKENMLDGKTTTWYTYAASLMQENPYLNLHFVGKLDSDTLFFPSRFIRWTQNLRHILNQTRVYGGCPIEREECIEWGDYCNTTNMKAPRFMTGAIQILSIEAARYISLGDIPITNRTALVLPKHEDITLANLVYHTFNESGVPVAVASMGHPRSHWIIFHPKKEPAGFRTNYWKHCGLSKRKRRKFHYRWTKQLPRSTAKMAVYVPSPAITDRSARLMSILRLLNESVENNWKFVVQGTSIMTVVKKKKRTNEGVTTLARTPK